MSCNDQIVSKCLKKMFIVLQWIMNLKGRVKADTSVLQRLQSYLLINYLGVPQGASESLTVYDTFIVLLSQRITSLQKVNTMVLYVL